jgi:ribosomal protein S18 acetylase RimI-like enzyme
MPPNDLLTQLGPLAFATRLRRLADRLSRDVSHVYEQLDIAFDARWFAVLYLLEQESPLPLTTVAHRLGLTHPAINQVAAEMTKAGLLLSGRDKADSRKRLLRLSKKGMSVAEILKPVWKDVADATEELLQRNAGSLMIQIDAVERALDETEMYERVMTRIRNRLMTAVEIIPFSPKLGAHFKSLNYEWLKKHFTVEPSDEEILSDPQGTVISKGGMVLFARIDKEIVGCVAMIRQDDDTYELAKLAVTAGAQGKQAGRKLSIEGIKWAEARGARTIILHTNPKLTAAITLYESLGFVRADDSTDAQHRHQRETFMMIRTHPKPVTA